ncbi:MAG: VIT domain-containing protein [Planctomycetota bacterium]
MSNHWTQLRTVAVCVGLFVLAVGGATLVLPSCGTSTQRSNQQTSASPNEQLERDGAESPGWSARSGSTFDNVISVPKAEDSGQFELGFQQSRERLDFSGTTLGDEVEADAEPEDDRGLPWMMEQMELAQARSNEAGTPLYDDDGNLLLRPSQSQMNVVGHPDAFAFVKPSRRQALAGAHVVEERLARDQKKMPPTFELAPGEELWVIAKAGVAATPSNDDPWAARCGMLHTTLPDVTHVVPVPLEHTAVNADINGYIGAVNVKQKFHNPYSTKIEATYVFPLPQNAAVNGFVMTIGDRTIRGVIREREEAEQIYAQARARGHVASLLTQERPNIFTQKVANIEPQARIDVDITYFHTLPYRDGAYEFIFPMVVGPRFNPSASPDPIIASPNGTPNPTSATQVNYLRPTERSGHDIAITVDVNAAMPIQSLTSRSHVIHLDHYSDDQATVTLSPNDTIPNKDFVLRIDVAGADVRSGLLTHMDESGEGFFSLMLVPPSHQQALQRQPLELVFLLDCSGSMSGKPMEQSKAAMRRALRSMNAEDTFQIIRFSADASALGPAPIAATPENIAQAMDYVDRLSGGGGTMMLRGIEAALDFPHDAERMRFVVFMTDGFIGNDQQILGAVHDKLGAARIFSFGVGSSPNRFLLDRLAQLGNGAVAYLGLQDPAVDVMDAFFQRVAHPALTDIALATNGLHEVYPRRIPDLFAGRPVILTGRFQGELPESITLSARLGAEDVTMTVPVEQAGATNDALATLWARTKIADLMNMLAWTDDPQLPEAVTQLALGFDLMSKYTAFVAVDSLSVTEGDHGVSVVVPVPVPEGVRYETTVSPQVSR